MRPVFLEYPQASEFMGDNRDFLFGRDFFVAPVTTEMADAEEEVALPPGEWLRLLDKREVVEQRKDHFASAARRDAALRARGCHRADAAPGLQSTEEKPNGPLKLARLLAQQRIERGLPRKPSIQDDGHTFAYQKERFYVCIFLPGFLRRVVTSHKQRGDECPISRGGRGWT